MSVKTGTIVQSAAPATYESLKHVAPKYRVSGYQTNLRKEAFPKDTNILAHRIKVPREWTQTGVNLGDHRMTKRKLEQNRNRAKQPHPSYDLDGDGGVSARDYFLAKQFDKNNDGILDETETRAAKKAIK